MTRKEFKLPDIGEGIAEGEIVSWRVQPGQQVKEEDEFVEVMTDKATVMITVPWDGVIAELLAKEGDVVPVETVIAVIETAGKGTASAPAPAQARATAPASAPAPERAAPVLVAAVTTGNFVQAEPGKVMAAPATRRRARELGIDLHLVPGTGPRGRITNEDLDSWRRAGGGPAPAAAAPGAPVAAGAGHAFTPMAIAAPPAGREEERVPFRGLRRKIAEAMSRSMFTATHFTYVDDIDVTKLVELRREAKELYVDQGVNITYLPFIMKALIPAMKAFPMMNASLDETTQELVVKKYYNFGVATDTDNGLVVPVVKDVDRKSIVDLARDIRDVAQRTREGKVSIDDLTGGTFSITNAGNIGGLFATPVINFPESAILGVHAIKKTPIVRDGEIVVGSVMYLSVSIDHRLVDGADGAHWMNMVKDQLENPTKLLLGGL